MSPQQLDLFRQAELARAVVDAAIFGITQEKHHA
jgi:hypothetical protein